MKFLFINPSRDGQGNIPLNIPILIAVLKKFHHQVRHFNMLDYDIFDSKNKEYESIFFKKAKIYPSEAEVVNDRKKFYQDELDAGISGLELKKTDYHSDFKRVLCEFKPDIIGINCLTVDFNFIRDFLRPFKKKYAIPIIFGGVHAILVPEDVLNTDICDFVCIGEGENCIGDLLNALQNKEPLENVAGIWFKKNGLIVKNPRARQTDLTALPPPNFEYFDPIHFYRPFDGRYYKMVNYEFSRGCPFNCTYCINSALREKYKGLGPYHREKNIGQSIAELKYLITKYNFNFVRFWDDDFTATDLEILKEYARQYIKEINLPFLIYSRVETISEQKVRLLKDMGCRTFAVGIESGNEFIRKKVMNRMMSNKHIIEKFNLVKSFGIRVSAYNIIGLPYETRENIFDTIELNKQVRADSFSVTLLEPYKGTPIRKMCEDQGLDPAYQVEQTFDKVHFVPKGMTEAELRGLFRAFPFYIRFPRERYPEIKIAESDDSTYFKLKKEFEKFK